MVATNLPEDIITRLTKLEQQVADLTRKSGNSTVRGTFAVTQEIMGSSFNLLTVGDTGLDALNRPTRGMILRRRDGHLAMTATSTSDADPGFVSPLYDLQSNYCVTDDVASGRGLARPYIPIGLNDLSAPTATTTSASFTALQFGEADLPGPVILLVILVQSNDPATTGQIRLTIDGSPSVGPVLSVTGNQFSVVTLGPFAHGIVNPAFLMLHTLAVEARRTAGTGTIGARVLSALNLESSWA